MSYNLEGIYYIDGVRFQMPDTGRLTQLDFNNGLKPKTSSLCYPGLKARAINIYFISKIAEKSNYPGLWTKAISIYFVAIISEDQIAPVFRTGIMNCKYFGFSPGTRFISNYPGHYFSRRKSQTTLDKVYAFISQK